MIGEQTMPATQDELKKIAALAYLDLDTEADAADQLADDVNFIMDYVEQLRQVDTRHIAPLRNPLDLHQRLRKDEFSDDNCVDALKKVAPMFVDDLYLVPKVID